MIKLVKGYIWKFWQATKAMNRDMYRLEDRWEIFPNSLLPSSAAYNIVVMITMTLSHKLSYGHQKMNFEGVITHSLVGFAFSNSLIQL